MSDRQFWRAAIMRDELYTINLYESEAEAQADLPRVQRRWGQAAFIEKVEDS